VPEDARVVDEADQRVSRLGELRGEHGPPSLIGDVEGEVARVGAAVAQGRSDGATGVVHPVGQHRRMARLGQGGGVCRS
jgi:hypothetical protein